jgi:hypothetical protein
MPTMSTIRRCPYCGERIELGDCPIVATNFPGNEFQGAAEFETSEIELPSGAPVLRRLERTGWPVVAESPRTRIVTPVRSARKRSKLEEAFSDVAVAEPEVDPALPPLTADGVRHEDLPARACTNCEFPLPQSIDTRKALVIAVVGVNRVGKTHLLASSLTQAYRHRGLAGIGCTLVPDDATSTRFMQHYYNPLFRRREILETTAEDDLARFQPLIFNVTLEGQEPFSLVVHDVAGEVFADRQRRAVAGTFLRAARGIVFVIDPRDIDDLRSGLPDWILDNNELGWDQGALLSACLQSDGVLEGQVAVPVAITVAKSDLLPLACGQELPFLCPAPNGESREAMASRIREYSREVAAFLEAYGAFSVLEPAREYAARASAGTGPGRRAAVTYHAVSALGANPDEDEQITQKVQPINCLDPLAAILLQLTSVG